MFLYFDSACSCLRATNLLEKVNELSLGDLALEAASLSIRNDDVLKALSFLWLNCSDIAQANVSLR